MVSKFWWLNFVLCVLAILMGIKSVMIWQENLSTQASHTVQKKQTWPEPVVIKRKTSEPQDYELIASKNLFLESRVEHLPEPEPELVPEVSKTEPPVKPEIELIKQLERKDITLFGVIIMNDFKTAFVNNIENKGDGDQIRVAEHDEIGEYTIEQILSDKLLVLYQGEKYMVPLFKKKENTGQKVKTKAVVSRENATPNIVSATAPEKEKQTVDQSKNTEEEYIIVDTPFGKIKRRKK